MNTNRSNVPLCLIVALSHSLTRFSFITFAQPECLLNYTGFEVKDIKEVAVLMEDKVGEVETTYSRRSLNAVKKKYAADKYDNVSSFVLPTWNHLF